MPPFWEIASVFFMSAFKYMVAVVMVFGYSWDFWYSVSFTVLGGMFGVVGYTFFGELLRKGIRFLFPRYKGESLLETRRGLIEIIRSKGGLIGLSLLTPVFLSVPVGTIAAIALGYRWPKILIYMFFAFSFWAFLFFGLYDFLGIDFRAWLNETF